MASERRQAIQVKEEASGPEVHYAKALFSFEARSEEEISFVAGQHLVIINNSDSGWWKVGRLPPITGTEGKTGTVPWPSGLLSLKLRGTGQRAAWRV